MEQDSTKIDAIKDHLSTLNSDERPPVVLLYLGKNHRNKKILLSKPTNFKETFYICSRKTYDSLKNLDIRDSYYICNSLEEAETIAVYIVENYKKIYKE